MCVYFSTFDQLFIYLMAVLNYVGHIVSTSVEFFSRSEILVVLNRYLLHSIITTFKNSTK
jgi:hypothetical protein